MTSTDKAKELLAQNGVDPDAKGSGKGLSQASQLVALARQRFDVFMSDDGRP
ncbi:hypothetical protein AB0F96_22035 [Streptomyces sp. NPDC023998]|uniref:hypothetical protein n=1 Tax=Streptomyces sp. NPDC023998 TaxID=3154597 RepID=UPI0034001319